MKHCPICEEYFKDELTECPKCNHVLVEGYLPAKSSNNKIPVFSIVVCAIGILFGVYMFFIGCRFVDGYIGSYGGYAAFGGDFYTEIYDQTSDVVTNTNYICENILMVGEALLKCIGAFITLHFTLQLSKLLSNKS
jgi:hypothetical protein